MSQRNSRRSTNRGPASTSGLRASSKPVRWIIAVLLAALVGGVTLWFAAQKRSAPIPRPDLAALDPAVVRLIEQKLNQVQAQPNSERAWGELGVVFWNYDLHAAARQCLTEAQRLNKAEPRWPYIQSLLLHAEAPDEAFSLLRRAVQLCGNDPEAPRVRLATLLLEDGRWSDAETELDALLRAKPDFAPALLLKARCAQAKTNITTALDLARRCGEDARTARAAAILIAALCVQAGDTSAASNVTVRISRIPPDEPVADPYRAEAALLRTDVRLLTEQTHPLLASGRLDTAKPLIEKLIRDHKDNAETWLLAGRYHLLNKEFSSAERCLRQHLQMNATSGSGWFQLGLLQIAQEQFAPAAETFLKATQLKADFGPAFYNRGFALLRLGNMSEAANAFREAVRLNPERIDSYLMLADIAVGEGDRKEATERLTQAEALNPTHPGIRQIRKKLLIRP